MRIGKILRLAALTFALAIAVHPIPLRVVTVLDETCLSGNQPRLRDRPGCGVCHAVGLLLVASATLSLGNV